MKSGTWMYIGAGALGFAALLAWAFAPRPLEVEVGTVSRGSFETTIEEDGKTRLHQRYVISAPLSGVLRRITLREGDTVETNQVVATLLPALPPMLDERTLRQQQEGVEIAQAQLGRADARVDATRLALAQASQALARSEQLVPQGFVSATRLETDLLSAAAARKELDAAVQERRAAGHQVDQARAALMTVQHPGRSGGKEFVLRAPAAGKVLRVTQTSETAVSLGTPLLEMGDIRGLEVVAELLTSDALQAKPGVRVWIDRWGGSGVLEGKVRMVEPAAFTKVSALGVEEQRVKLVIDITSPADQWRALGEGFRVGVRIVTMSVADAITVPTSAVFPMPDREGAPPGSMAVFTLDGNRARMTPVKVVARNGAQAWVPKDLPPGTTVIIYPSSEVKEGVRIKSHKV